LRHTLDRLGVTPEEMARVGVNPDYAFAQKPHVLLIEQLSAIFLRIVFPLKPLMSRPAELGSPNIFQAGDS